MIARREGYLPPFFQQQNENEIPVNILVIQGGITTVIALLYALVPSVSSAYWILSVMTTQIYLIVYLLMFVAAVKLRRNQPDVERGYRAPALTFLCVVGFVASAAAIVIGFVPPSQFESGSALAYGALILAGTVPARPAAAVAVPEVAQARLEDGRGRRRPSMSAPAPPPPEEPPSPAPERPEPAAAIAGCTGSPVPSSSFWSPSDSSPTAARRRQRRPSRRPSSSRRSSSRQGCRCRRTRTSSSSRWAPTAAPSARTLANALGEAIQNDMLTNGADFVGRRPVIVDRRLVVGEALILETYCPDKLDQYQDKIDELKYDDTIEP